MLWYYLGLYIRVILKGFYLGLLGLTIHGTTKIRVSLPDFPDSTCVHIYICIHIHTYISICINIDINIYRFIYVRVCFLCIYTHM